MNEKKNQPTKPAAKPPSHNPEKKPATSAKPAETKETKVKSSPKPKI